MFISYIDLLKKVQMDGVHSAPSDVSLNRSFETKELENIQLEIDDFKQLLLDDDEVSYVEHELDWYLGKISFDQRMLIKELAKKLLGCVNRAGPNSNYGQMCLRQKNEHGLTQLEWVTEKLKKDKQSRHAIAFYNSPKYQYWDNDDFVCTLTQMFSIKDNKLNTTVNIRSNDLINCFRIDSIWYRMFQSIVWKELLATYPDLKIGKMTCNIFSAHYYFKDEHKIAEIMKRAKDNTFKSIDRRYL